MKWATRAGAAIGNGLAELLYPPMCEVTGRPLTSGRLSAEARSAFGLLSQGPSCRRCGAHIGPYAHQDGGCDLCRSERFHFDRVYRLGPYDGLLSQACRRLKRVSGHGLGGILMELLWEKHGGCLAKESYAAVVAVPLHRWTHWLRGFNPSQVLAAELAQRLQRPAWRDVLVRVRLTRPQHFLSPTERRRNVIQAFRGTRRRDLAGAKILLVDDVLTTGATASDAARALRSIGADRVDVAVLARGGTRRERSAETTLEAGTL